MKQLEPTHLRKHLRALRYGDGLSFPEIRHRLRRYGHAHPWAVGEVLKGMLLRGELLASQEEHGGAVYRLGAFVRTGAGQPAQEGPHGYR